MTPDQKSDAMALFIQFVLPVLFSGLATILGWVFVQLGKKLGAQAGESKLSAAGAKLAHWADVVVADLEATMRPELGKATADGVLTKEEVEQLRSVALARLKALAGGQLNKLLSVIGVAPGEVDKYLGGIVERAVTRMEPTKSSP